MVRISLKRLFAKDKLVNQLARTMMTMFFPLLLVLISFHIAIHIASAKMNSKLQTLTNLQHEISIAELGLTEQESGQRGYDLTGTPLVLTSFRQGTNEFNLAVSQTNSLFQSDSVPNPIRSDVKQMLQDGQAWHQSYGLPQINARKANQAITSFDLEQGQYQFSKFMMKATQALQQVHVHEKYDERSFMFLSHLLWSIIEIMSVLLVLLVFIFSTRKIQSMVRPITSLTEAVSAYSEENFDVPVPSINENNELQSLITGVDTMRKSLKQHFDQMQSERISLFDNSPKVLFRLNARGELLELSQAASRTLGYTCEELLGRHFLSILNRFSRKIAVSAFKATLTGAGQKNVELNVTANNNETCTFNVTMLPIQVNGSIVEVYGIAENITEVKRMESFVQKADKLNTVGEFAAGIAHEIRNPLTVVQGFLQLMKSQKHYEERYIETISSETERMKSIISEFMLLAKPPRPELKAVRLRLILEDVVGLLNTQAILRNADIVLTMRAEPQVNCASDQLKQVFINLIKNSIEAMDDTIEGKIGILVYERDDGFIVVRFMDNGCGIPQDKIEKLGEPFYTTKEDGNGLGLMICYRIIEQHHGTMAIQSERGKGTTIDVILPQVVVELNRSGKAFA